MQAAKQVAVDPLNKGVFGCRSLLESGGIRPGRDLRSLALHWERCQLAPQAGSLPMQALETVDAGADTDPQAER